MTKKMTKKDWFKVMLEMGEVKANAGVVEFINKEIELLEKKNSANRKPTATQIENEKIREIVLEVMEENNIYTVTQIMKLVQPIFTDTELTNQRVSAVIRPMIGDTIKRFEDKGKAYFQKI